MNNLLKTMSCLALLAFTACGEEKKGNDDRVQTQDISKDGAIETVVSTEHLNDTFDIMTTTHKIWKNNAIVKEVIYLDTLPALGKTSLENTEGESKVVNKDYEFYITVK
jgi:hypothetical protein